MVVALQEKNRMKNILIACVITGGTFLSTPQMTEKTAANCDPGVTINTHYSKSVVLDSILKKFAPQWLPGVSIAIYTETEGWWASAHGYANVKTRTPMENCHLQYLQSVSKSYMAVEILQLNEEGRIDLDAPMTKYFPKYSQYINKITVCMLLNHTLYSKYNTTATFFWGDRHPLRNLRQWIV
jgi:D-alanyl-D-alanine carboxypeptidase